MSAAKITRLVLVLAAGVVATFFAWREMVDESRRAVALLAKGKTVTASVTDVGIGGARGGRDTQGRIEYKFTAENGQSYSGRSYVDVAIIYKISDPADRSKLLPNASVEVVYLAGNPSVNGVVEDLESMREVPFYLVVTAFVSTIVIAFLVITRLMEVAGFLEPPRKEA
jgi:hypothetical protein